MLVDSKFEVPGGSRPSKLLPTISLVRGLRKSPETTGDRGIVELHTEETLPPSESRLRVVVVGKRFKFEVHCGSRSLLPVCNTLASTISLGDPCSFFTDVIPSSVPRRVVTDQNNMY